MGIYMITDHLVRIIVLDIANLYASVCDEAYLPADRYDLQQEFLYRYRDRSRYLCIKK